MPRPLAITSLVAVCGFAPAQQPTWLPRPTTQVRDPAAMVYDAARQRTVLVVGEQTFEWQAGRWAHRTVTPGRPAWDAVFTYDQLRQVCVLFIGVTWEYDGNVWLQRAPAASPYFTVRSGAFDPTRGRTVVFGGHWSTALCPDGTWEWDGASWSQMPTTLRPSSRAAHGMAFDSVNQRTLLFGGWCGTTSYDDTWHWDGLAWQQVATAVRPGPRSWPAMTLDAVRSRVVLFGGLDASFAPLSDTWEWDGSAWSQAVTSGGPSPRNAAAMAYERHGNRTLLFGGRSSQSVECDTWSWDGTQWQLEAECLPLARFGNLVADTARGNLVVFGGATAQAPSDETWTGDGLAWSRRAVVPSPPPRAGAGLAYDESRAEVVMFGGVGAGPPLSDTWAWNGASWSVRTPATRPSAGSHPMAYDAANQRILLCESGAATGNIEVWTWSGTGWSLLPAATRPLPRSSPSVGYDATRQRLVLFGGNRSCGFACVTNLADTWLWDGGQWTQAVAAGPGPRSAAEMIDDPVRGRLVMVGGHSVFASPQIHPQVWLWPWTDAWEWDGATWTSLGLSHSASLRQPQGAFDPVRQRVVLSQSDLIVLSASPATSQIHGTGCGGVGGPPWITGNPPTLGNLAFALDIGGVPAHAPSLIGLALTAGSMPLSPGCDLLLGPLLSVAFATANAAGFLSLPAPVPPDPTLRGLVFHAQALVLDATAPAGFALTARLRVTLGD